MNIYTPWCTDRCKEGIVARNSVNLKTTTLLFLRNDVLSMIHPKQYSALFLSTIQSRVDKVPINHLPIMTRSSDIVVGLDILDLRGIVLR